MTGAVIPKLLTENQVIGYLSLSRNKVRQIGKEANCVIHIGRCIRYDKQILDEYIDSQLEGHE